MTQDEHRAQIASVLDGMVEVDIFRVVGIDHLCRRRYVLTAAAFDGEPAQVVRPDDKGDCGETVRAFGDLVRETAAAA